MGARPPRVTVEQVRGVMDQPPVWLVGSYLPAWRSGRFSTRVLAYGVTAALGRSAYDDETVGEEVKTTWGLGYRDSCAPKPYGRSLTELGEANAEDTDWM